MAKTSQQGSLTKEGDSQKGLNNPVKSPPGQTGPTSAIAMPAEEEKACHLQGSCLSSPYQEFDPTVTLAGPDRLTHPPPPPKDG